MIDLDDTAPVFDLDLSSFEILEFDDLGAGFSSTLIFLFTFQFQQKGIDKLFIIFVLKESQYFFHQIPTWRDN